MKLSEVVNHYKAVLEIHGDMEMATLREAYYDYDENYHYDDKYSLMESMYLGSPKKVYFYDSEYYTDLPYEHQKNDARWIYVADIE